MSKLPVPLDVSSAFSTYFESSSPLGPASLPVPNPTKPFWSHPGLSSDWPTDPSDPDGNKDANPYAKEGAESPLPDKVDLVIIGSGITGVSIALELSKLVRAQNARKMRVAILEARDFCSGATARNGGHLAAHVASGYSHFSRLYDSQEVKRCFEVEQHTVSTLVSIIKENGWEKYVDLVEGGRNYLMFSENELMAQKLDWKKSIEAGIITEDAGRWYTADETNEEYGTSYPMCRIPGYNLWPLKLVTKLFELARGDTSNTTTILPRSPEIPVDDARSNLKPQLYLAAGARSVLQKIHPISKTTTPNNDADHSSKNGEEDQFNLSIYTNTPVHAVVAGDSASDSRWSIQTSRGNIDTDYVVYATNAYTSYLIPHLAGEIVPVRGQVCGIRAKVGYTDEGWTGRVRGLSKSGWLGNEGFEYWFPRPNPILHAEISSSAQETESESSTSRKPLIILGGGRETLMHSGYAMYDTDDSSLDPQVSIALRAFLGKVFPGQFPGEGSANRSDDGVEIEWSGIMGFTRSGDPMVGRVKNANGTVVSGQYLSAGYTGHGMPRAYACAEILASLIWNDIMTDTIWTPPEWLPRHYLTETFK